LRCRLVGAGAVLGVGRSARDRSPPPSATVDGDAGASAVDSVDASERPVGPRVPEQLWPLLDGAVDPVRTVGLFRRWLDATQMGVALVWADSELSVVSANRAFEAWIRPENLPFEAKPWQTLCPSADLDRLTSAAEEVVKTAEARSLSGCTVTSGASGAPQAVWDLELCPVTDGGGAVTHLLVLVTDVTAEVAISRRLDPLVALTST